MNKNCMHVVSWVAAGLDLEFRPKLYETWTVSKTRYLSI